MNGDSASTAVLCLLVLAGIPFRMVAQTEIADPVEISAGSGAADRTAADSSASDSPVLPLAPNPFVTPILPKWPPPQKLEDAVDWQGLAYSSLRFLAVEHSFRLLTEPGTRTGLKGSFLENYGRSVANLHGWADGDPFYVNYVGHPMQGGVAGFLWVHNDAAYRNAVFGKNRLYWKSRLRAAAFAWCYSTQFEIGPLSEASIGAIQSQFPEQGFVDHVITPTIGLAWMIAEDSVDRYVIERIESHTRNRYARLLARSALNPSRTFSNVLNGVSPWYRTTRAGITSYAPRDGRGFDPILRPAPKPVDSKTQDGDITTAFEFAVTFQPERFWGDGKSLWCLGGGGETAFRLAPYWQLVAEVGGCKMVGLEKNLSGDSLTYATGPRWLGRIWGPWNAHVQFLVGGNKISEERMYPGLKEVLEATAVRANKPPPPHGDYTQQTESNGLMLDTGCGLTYELNRALTIRVADISYRHNWTATLWGHNYSNNIKLNAGLVLRMGRW